MSQTIDNRIVEMQFDNKQFEANVATSMSTLDKLKQKLNFTGASKGLNEINSAAKKIDMSGVGAAVESVKLKFSALEVAGVAALATIASKAVSVGGSIVKSLTLDPVTTGFQEYELKLNSIQTILANTQSKGTTMTDVVSALNTLNTYADQTIYNFAEMTRNIGTFTAAGVGLDSSVAAIKGIANLAAISGSSSAQASQAMYQLSQALAAGRVSLMDWNSVVNAGMGGEVFQNALKRTARQMGINVDEIIEKYGSFKDSLTEGQWLTTDVLTETLAQLSGAYTEADLIAQGYTESQAKEIVKLAETAVSAATDVKTFSQLMDTTKDAIQSGWAQTWEIIIGDFEEAKELFSGISNTLGDMISSSSEWRNTLLQGWKNAGGRDDLIKSFKNIFDGLTSVIVPIKEAFTDIFPPITTKNLLNFTEGLKDLTSKMKLSEDSSRKLKDTFKGLFSILDIGKQAVSSVVKPLFEFATGGTVGSIGNAILTLTAGFGNFFTKLNEGIKEGEVFSSVGDVISNVLSGIGDAISFVIDIASGMGDAFSKAGDIVSGAFSGIANAVGSIFDWLRNNISADDIFAGLAGGGLLVLAKKISGILDPIKEAIDSLFGNDLLEAASGFGDVLSSVHDSLSAFQDGIRVASLVGIAGAIALLSSALKTISDIDAASIGVSLAAIAGMMVVLNGGFKTLVGVLDDFDSKGTLKASVAMIAMAEAINIIADAIKQLSDLSFGDIAQGLLTVGVSLTALVKGVNALGDSKVSVKTSLAIIAVAEACKILADAVKEFADLNIGDTVQGLIAMGGALGELVAVLAIVSKFGGNSLVGATSLLIAVQTLDDIADALERIGNLSWEEIARGLTGMGLALAELATVSGLIGTIAGSSGLIGAATLVISVESLDELADALGNIGSLNWEEIRNGLVGMGLGLGELAVVTSALGKLGGLSSFLGGGSLLIAVQSLGDLADAMQKFGDMTFEGVVNGLVGMGLALAELGVITSVLGSVAALPSLIGGGSLLLAVQGLGDLADAFQKFGSMSWDETVNGLKSMAAALGATALGGIINTLSGFGAGAISEVAVPLGQLADSVKKWNGVTVPEGLGTQLASLGSGLKAFTFGGWGAETISTLAVPLGTLADSIKKWSGVAIPENLGSQLFNLALGVQAFTFGGLGAGTLLITANGLNILADALFKFQQLDFSGVGSSLGILSGGLRDLGSVGITSLATGFQNAALTIYGKAQEIVSTVSTMISSTRDTIFSSVPSIVSGFRNIMYGIYSAVQERASAIIGGMRNIMTGFLGAISEKRAAISSAMSGIMTSISGAINSGASAVVGAIRTVMSNFVNAIRSTGSSASSAMRSIISSITSTVSGAASTMYSAGANIVQGLINGIRGMASAAVSTASWVASQIASAARSALDIHSPSRVFEEIGENTVLGLAKGIDDNIGVANGIGEYIASAIKSVGPEILESTKNIALGISSIIQSTGVAIYNFVAMVIEKCNDYIQSGYESFYTSGARMLQGLIDSIEGYVATVFADGKELGKTLTDTVSESIEENGNITDDSAKDLGESLVDKVAEGIKNNASTIDEAGKEVGDSLASNISNSIKDNEEYFDEAGRDIGEAIITNVANTVNDSDEIGEIGDAVIDHVCDNEDEAYDSEKALGYAILNGMNTVVENLKKTLTDENVLSSGITIVSTLYDKINEKKPEIVKALQDLFSLMSTLVQAYGSFITEYVDENLQETITIMSEKYRFFYAAGKFLVEGLRDGIVDYTYLAVAAAEALAAKVEAASKGALGIHSPSEVFMEIGKYTVQGFVDGINDNLYKISSSGANIGDEIISAVSLSEDGRRIGADFISNLNESLFLGKEIPNRLSSLLSFINGNMDLSPTIKPVLDLEDVQKKSKILNTMFSSNLAISTGARFSANSSSSKVDNGPSENKSNSFQFIQNNYSPKALSRIEIYRRTKNQFSEIKGLIDK